MITASLVTSASADEIWKIWTDVEKSIEWDTDVASSKLKGPFLVGTQGEFKLKDGPTFSFTLDEVLYKQQYRNTVRKFGLNLTFDHQIKPITDDQNMITHSVIVSGPLGKILKPILEPKLKRALSQSLKQMLNLAEKKLND